MIILGIDPGYAIVGYGLIEKNNKGQVKVIDYGAISTPKEQKFHVRLTVIHDALNAIIDKYKPDAVAIEELFFNQNITTGIAVAEARGVILCTAAKKIEKLFEFTPMEIKISIAGYGKADKKQVQYMTKEILGLKEIPKPDDAADALAVALCLAQTNMVMASHNIEVFTNNNLKKYDYKEALKGKSNKGNNKASNIRKTNKSKLNSFEKSSTTKSATPKNNKVKSKSLNLIDINKEFKLK